MPIVQRRSRPVNGRVLAFSPFAVVAVGLVTGVVGAVEVVGVLFSFAGDVPVVGVGVVGAGVEVGAVPVVGGGGV
jgi:hypothetical protein